MPTPDPILVGHTKALSLSFSRKPVHPLKHSRAFYLFFSSTVTQRIALLVNSSPSPRDFGAFPKPEVTRRYRGAGVAIQHSHMKFALALLPYTQSSLFLKSITN